MLSETRETDYYSVSYSSISASKGGGVVVVTRACLGGFLTRLGVSQERWRFRLASAFLALANSSGPC